jgi:glycosyltransferase involved in cell wall biosynthesis
MPFSRLHRIALVATSLDIVGGHGIQARELLRGLTACGLDVRIVPINPRFPLGLQWVRRAPGLRTLLNQALYLPRLAAIRDVDVVHVFSASYWSFLLASVPAMLAARACGRPVVLHYHSGEAEDHLARWGCRVHPWLRRADRIVVPSRYLHDVFARHGYRTQVIPNVVDTGRFAFRERARLRPRLLSVRNLERHYGVETILRAFSLVRARRPGATLVVAGVGSQAAALRRLAEQIGTAGLLFLGRVDPAHMPELMNESDILLNASFVDNQPCTLLEAFASGLPIVTTPAGDIPSLVRDGETGRVVPVGDAAAMAQAALELLADPDTALRLACRARSELERYTWDHVQEAWMDVYTRVVERPRRVA